MAVRTMVVRPEPETGMVDREKLVQAIMDAEATLWVSGGVLAIVVERSATGFPGEMVTTAVMIEWKDRTDAKPQPEQPISIILGDEFVVPEPEPPVTAAPAPVAPVAERAPVAPVAAAPEPVAPLADDELAEEEEEDLSEIPAGMR